MTTLLEVRGLRAGYGRTTVVRDLDLTVEPGEVVALLGPNGAGKTTTLLTIAGLLPQLGGSVRFGGAPDERRPQALARAGLALVPDDRGLFPSLTVAEHLTVGTDRAGRTAAVERVVGWFPALGVLLDRRVGLLSGGEQQMLALAVALEREPSLLMVDELSLGLAPLVVQSFVPVLRKVVAATGCGVLLVEQHATVALELASRAVVLSHGEVRLDEATARLRAEPGLLRDAYLG